MRLQLTTTAALAVLAFGATSAAAQDTASTSWTGPYVGGQLGYSWQPSDGDETITFDRGLDGTFGDTVVTGTGANAFSPGFCGGRYNNGTRAGGCRKDNDATAWKLHAGYDYQFGAGPSGFVVGAVAEGGVSYLYDYVTAFSTTPNAYTIGSRLTENYALRGRAGYAASTGTMIYGTGGATYGKIRNRYRNANNLPFSVNDRSKWQWGWNYGGGIEQKVGKFSVGALYLFTVMDNDDFVVRQTGAAPFTATNPQGTDFRRTFSKFAFHQLLATVSYRF
ncbi:outer membrane protein [Sphingomonas crocodyli]|uniref:Porin family protein n=1 Tax=Sphingomonas crocodyli TaxID=1979270 RepID=A0A437LYH9_9SPHN|nr:outer membrane beta-barrel protein [Sphingomonas crocodyli]RVT90425.1 porin family protein [Sphingomonas crocodyli]